MPGPVQDTLDGFADVSGHATAEPVVMSLNPEYYELVWAGQKTHEFRRRFLSGVPVTWYMYLTAPESRLAAVVDLDPAVVAPPRDIAALAELARPGNGASVAEYLDGLSVGYAMPIRRVREFEGLGLERLREHLGAFHPPQGYVRIDGRQGWREVHDELTAGRVVRELDLGTSGA